ncbi:DUF4238 domain-containing protein [Leptospira yasudae]|uniref:DUF4238 domain-containing protein n=1 Tax=Leptospira yasudae TaxID=2202201 RepID=A0ABX9LX94_9LEPT|nr:DUF4238 domain-containing protein [Leptospira yasudae]RHX77489.1 hypothetical protein DLM77_20935 [Leptospira yasudae]
MPEKKRHHYVPKLYLRYFSKDLKSITVFSIKSAKVVSTQAPIARQCYEDYLYGKDPGFENKLGELEGATQTVLKKIHSQNRLPKKGTDDYFILLVFIMYQQARTLYAADQTDEWIDKLAKTIVKLDLKASGRTDITPEEIDSAKITLKEPAKFNIRAISENIPLLLDMDCKLIVNRTKKEFITSDNPVILYNKYYLNEDRNYTGLACKGLLIFYPLSSKHYLIYFDPNIYLIRNSLFRKFRILKNSKDCHSLNILQTINANENLYTLNSNEEELLDLLSKAKGFRSTDKFSVQDFILKKRDGKVGQFIHSSKQRIRFNLEISFLTVKKKIDKFYLNQFLVREPALVKLHQEFIAGIDDRKYKPSEWAKFLKDKKEQSKKSQPSESGN